MKGKEFLELLRKMAEGTGEVADQCRLLRCTIDHFGRTGEPLKPGEDDAETVEAIRNRGQAELKRLDETQTAGQQALAQHAELAERDGAEAPSLADWLKDPGAKEQAKALAQYLEILEAAEREKILGADDPAKALEAEISAAKSKIGQALEHLDTVAANVRTREAEEPTIAEEAIRRLPKVQRVTIAIIIVTAGVIIGYGFIAEGQLELLKDNATARAFITLLFAVGALSIFMVITTAIVFDVNSSADKIYERAKTILSMLLGIFGTVLGFYYGVAEGEPGAQAFAVREIEVVEMTEAGILDFVTSVEEGTGPYKFFVHVTDADGNPIEGTVMVLPTSASGTLRLTAPMKLAAQSGKEITIHVDAKDSTGLAAKSVTKSLSLPAAD